MALIEIDGLPFSKMVDLSMAKQPEAEKSPAPTLRSSMAGYEKTDGKNHPLKPGSLTSPASKSSSKVPFVALVNVGTAFIW